jgi:hypothetical protein
MRVLLTALLLTAAPFLVSAFTNGTLLPSYLCGPQGDGYPKSVGTLIPYLILGGTADTEYNQFPPGLGTVPIQIFDGTNLQGNAIAPSAKQIIGAFHNGQPQTNYTTAMKNPVWLCPSNANFMTGAANYTIAPGQEHNFALVVHDGVYGAGFNPAGVALDGAFMYAIDTKTNQRIGAWKNAGPQFSAWPACNLNQQFSLSVGIVHNALISENPSVTNLIWVAPRDIQGTVKFIGAGVTDLGYGPFSVEFNTTRNHTAPSVATQGLVPNAGNADMLPAPFVAVDAAPDLPWNKTAAANNQRNDDMMNKRSAIGLGVGLGFFGAFCGIGGAVFFMKRKQKKQESGNFPLL